MCHLAICHLPFAICYLFSATAPHSGHFSRPPTEYPQRSHRPRPRRYRARTPRNPTAAAPSTTHHAAVVTTSPHTSTPTARGAQLYFVLMLVPRTSHHTSQGHTSLPRVSRLNVFAPASPRASPGTHTTLHRHPAIARSGNTRASLGLHPPLRTLGHFTRFTRKSSFMIAKLAHRDHPNQLPSSAYKLPDAGSRQIGPSGPNPRK